MSSNYSGDWQHPMRWSEDNHMDLFTEHYRVIGVESQRLLLKGVRTGETLTIINADPETPLTEKDYPIGELISLTDESPQIN